MTNKEAIRRILDHKRVHSLNEPRAVLINEALDLAIKALEEQDKKGEWIEGENGNIKCNKCGAEIRYSYLANNKPDFPKFCCDCGAKMKKGGTE